jgi:hypothetical protein
VRKRTLALLIAGTFLFGTAAACSDDDNGGNTTTTAGDDGGDSGDGGGGSSSKAEVQDFCDAAAEFAQAVEDANGDPAALGDLSAQGQELATQAGDLAGAGLSAEDAEVVQECSQQVTDAVAGLAGG